MSQATGLRSGSLYPVLTRLADEGLTTSYIEDVDASTVGRPRRRYHRLTSNGILAANQAAREAAQLGAREHILRRCNLTIVSAGVGVLIVLAVAIVKTALQREYDDYAPPLARLVARAAVMLLPGCVRQQHREEWLSDLYEASSAGKGAGLIRSFGFVSSALVLAIPSRIAHRAEIYRRLRIVYCAVAWWASCLVINLALVVTGPQKLTLLVVVWVTSICGQLAIVLVTVAPLTALRLIGIPARRGKRSSDPARPRCSPHLARRSTRQTPGRPGVAQRNACSALRRALHGTSRHDLRRVRREIRWMKNRQVPAEYRQVALESAWEHP